MGKTMNPKSMIFFLYYFVLISSIIFTCACNNSTIDGGGGGFTTDLIHRDSPNSPLYDLSSTDSERLANAVEWSRLRARALNDTRKAAESSVTYAGGPYLMRLAIGSHRELVLAAMDTGSPITWTQCLPCNRCIRQRLPIFRPSASTSYKDVRCGSAGCNAFRPNSACDKRGEKCIYVAHYGDGSYSHGAVATETFSFWSTAGKNLRFDGVVFGCGHNNAFVHLKGSASGIVGLAGGKSSLVRQLGYDKFSYCLASSTARNQLSKLHFGEDAAVAGGGAVTTPLQGTVSYYYLTLEAVSVGNRRIEFHNPFLIAGGNMIIDSGSLLTYVPANFYEELEGAVVNSIRARAVRGYGSWRLCYAAGFEMPKMTAHFKGADVEWGFENVFIRVSNEYVCMAMEPAEGSVPIYGNVAQVNYLVGFDLGRETVSFKRTTCGA